MNITFVLLFVVPVISGAIILVAGAIFLIIDSMRKKKTIVVETQDWETTGGKIISVRMEQHEERKEGAQTEIKYEPVIEYVYTVKESEYRSNKIFPGDNIYFSQKDAQEILDEHPLNMYVPVKYNPEDPSMSSLENRPSGDNYVRLAGLVLTSFGLLVCCFATFMTLLALGKYK